LTNESGNSFERSFIITNKGDVFYIISNCSEGNRACRQARIYWLDDSLTFIDISTPPQLS
jgi:hypothetical protein